MAREVVVFLDNRIRFTTTKPVSVDDAIASLRGMDRMVRAHVPKAVRKLTGAVVKEAELQVNAIEEGSLITDTVIKLIFGSQKQADKFLNGIRKRFVTKNQKGETVVKGWVAGVLLVGLTVSAVGWYQASQGSSVAGGGLVSFEGDNNVILTIGAEAYQTDPQAFSDALDRSMTAQQKRSAAKAGVQMMAPATGSNGAGVELQSGSHAVELLTPKSAAKIPREIVAPDNSQDQTYKKVKLKFRASDGDSDSRGWAGTIDRLVDKRTRVIFAVPTDSAKVMYKPDAEVDATVTYSDAAHTKPILIIVERVY